MLDPVGTGKRLKKARKAAGYKTAISFCNANKISQPTYSAHENGTRTMRSRTAMHYAQLLKLNPNWLITGIGSPFHQEDDISNPENHDQKHTLEIELDDSFFQSNYKSVFTNDFDLTLFNKITMEIVRITDEINYDLNIDALTKKALEIYNSIKAASEDRNEHFTMAFAAIDLLKKDFMNRKSLFEELDSSQDK